MVDNKLRDLLSKSYSFRLSKIDEEVEKIAPLSRIIFSSYTGHDKNHLKNVESYANDIIPDNIKSLLNEEEIFCLICAIQLHDIGMIPIENERVDFENKSEKERENCRLWIRKNHHIRSQAYILNHKEKFGFSDLEAKTIGKIAKGHRAVNLEKYDNIRTRSLAAVLRLADECDITKSRESSLSQESIDNKTQKEHFKKHELFQKVEFTQEHITLKCVIYEDKNKETILFHKNKIQKELDNIKPYLKELNIMLTDVKLDVIPDEKYTNSKVLLTIAEDKDISSLESEWISSSDLDDSIDFLATKNMIKKEKDNWTISEAISIFKKIFVNFPNNDRNRFFFTKYTQNMVKKYFHQIENLFNIDYNFEYENSEGFRNERIRLLKMSPTAFYLLLTTEKIVKDPDFNLSSNQNGTLMMDLILFFGLVNDMHHYPEKINFDEIRDFIKDNFDEDIILSRINFCQKSISEELNE